MSRASILIAEDNPDIRSVLDWMLQSEGYDVVTAEDGAAAYQSITQIQPDVILTDLMMPEVDGLELIRRVRGTKEVADTPIVAMSAYGEDYFIEASAAGATAAIRKPDDIERLVETIERVLPTDRS